MLPGSHGSIIAPIDAPPKQMVRITLERWGDPEPIIIGWEVPERTVELVSAYVALFVEPQPQSVVQANGP